MYVLGAYFGWIFVGVVVILLFILIRKLLEILFIDLRSLKPVIRRLFNSIYLLLYVGFLIITYRISQEVAEELIRSFMRLESFFSYFFSYHWQESAELALVNLTIYSLLCLAVLIAYRLFVWARGPAIESKSIFVGKIGNIVYFFVILLFVTSSIITIIMALSS